MTSDDLNSARRSVRLNQPLPSKMSFISGPRHGERVEETYVEAFSQRATEVSEQIAVIDPGSDKQLTYRQLEERSSQLAHLLREHVGLEPDATGQRPVIAIHLQRSLELAIAPLAIWKVGATYLPLDPDYPPERIALLLSDSGARCILSTTTLSLALPSTGLPLLCMDAEAEAISGASSGAPALLATPDDPAYLIYTSGSTGRPKGVMISHRNLLHHNLGVIEAYGLRADDRVLQFASISFDISVEELFPTWLLGATLVLKTRAAAVLHTGTAGIGPRADSNRAQSTHRLLA